VPLKREQRLNADGSNVLELKTHDDFEIRYTTDGSNPKESGGIYSDEILLPSGCQYVRAAVYHKGNLVGNEDIRVTPAPPSKKTAIKDSVPLEYTLSAQKKCGDTESAYAEFAKLKQLPGTQVRHFTVTITEKKNTENYMEITTAKVPWDTSSLQAMVDLVRETAFSSKDVEVEFEYKTVMFATGAAFRQWIEMNKLDAGELEKKGAIKQ
jgi:hypothetical protein